MQYQNLTLGIAGLYTLQNELSQVPEGALSQATNCYINRDGIIEPRRGFETSFSLPGSGNYADAFFEFWNELVVHYQTAGGTGGSLGYYNSANSTFYPFSGSFYHPSSSYKMRFALANQNMYFTTSAGVYKLDVLNNQPVLSGVPPALDVEASVTGTSGFLNTQSSVAYRVVWGFTDANNNLLMGAPSMQAIANNPSTTATSTVNVTFTIPEGITTSYFYQIYRSDQIAYTGGAPSTPDDNCQLVYEGNPTSAQITAGTITVNDITPDALRGTALYTNPNQETILQANDRPPFCTDVALFGGCLFFANTSTTQSFSIAMLAVGSPSGVQVGDTITIGGVTYTAGTTQSPSTNTFEVVTSGSASQNIANTASNLVQCINQSTTNTGQYAYYTSSPDGLPGQMSIQNRSVSGAAFSVTASRASSWSPSLPSTGTTAQSTNQSNPNGLMFSKSLEPESVPAENIFYVGSASFEIDRIVALRDALFILKRDGVFILTGSYPNFSVTTLDNTVFINAPQTAVPLGNTVFALTTQGAVQISDTGVSIISRPIEDELNSIVQSVGQDLSLAFGIAYESDRSYYLYLPETSASTSCSLAYVYNYLTKTWVEHSRNQLAPRC